MFLIYFDEQAVSDSEQEQCFVQYSKLAHPAKRYKENS